MTKEVTRVQQMTADDEKRDAILKTRHQLAKKEYQNYLHQKYPHHKTLPKHNFVILGNNKSAG